VTHSSFWGGGQVVAVSGSHKSSACSRCIAVKQHDCIIAAKQHDCSIRPQDPATPHQTPEALPSFPCLPTFRASNPSAQQQSSRDGMVLPERWVAKTRQRFPEGLLELFELLGGQLFHSFPTATRAVLCRHRRWKSHKQKGAADRCSSKHLNDLLRQVFLLFPMLPLACYLQFTPLYVLFQQPRPCHPMSAYVGFTNGVSLGATISFSSRRSELQLDAGLAGPR
jgi:hypothetical protein